MTTETDVKKTKNITNNEKVFTNLEQYILSRHLGELAKFNEGLARPIAKGGKGEFKYCTFRQVNGPGSQLINRLRGIDDLSVFYNIKASTLSLLQPKIRLYKIQYADYSVLPNGEVDQSSVRSLPVPCYKEFKFSDNFGVETAASVNDYLSYESTKPSFRNVGLYGFTMTQDGETHGTIENNIECKLELKFKSLKDLNASPPGEPKLKYTDLILWPPARITKGAETYNPKYYEIKALIGYTAPERKQLEALHLSQREVSAIRDIEKMNQIVSLGMYDYDIKISENGVVAVTVSFRGRLETVIGSNQVNIFQDSIRIGESGQFELEKKAKSEMNISHVYKTATTIKALYKALNEARCTGKCSEKKTLKDLTEKDPLFSLLVKEGVRSSQATGTDREKLAAAGLKIAGSKGKLKVKAAAAGEKYYEWFKRLDNIKLTLGHLKKKVGAFKQDIYVGFIDALVQTHNIKATPPEKRSFDLPPTRVFCATANPEDVVKSIGVLRKTRRKPEEGEGETSEDPTKVGEMEVSQSELEKALKRFNKDVAEGDVGFTFGRCKPIDLSNLKIQNEAAGAVVGADGIEAESKSAEAAADTEGAPDTKPPKGNAPSWMHNGNYKFYFVYLGDIIELACKNARLGALDFGDLETKAGRNATIFPWKEYKKVKEQDGAPSYPLVNARILLGPLEYVNEEGNIQTTNLAKMPISFAYFRSWFTDKLVKRRRTQMPLGAFFASLINDLVIPALGIDMPQSFKVPHTRASIISITLPGEVAPGTHRICGKNVPNTVEALPEKREIYTESAEFKKYLRKIVGKRESESMLQTSYDYLLLYVTSFKDVTDRNADPAIDIKDGIYHFNIGSDMGLLRSMEFNKVNIPFLAELRSSQAEEQGIDQMQQLKLPYDTNVNLVGTSLFTPGMYYYVNPSLAGLGSVKDASSLAYQMNLGGYHLIGKVSTRISPGRFETQIIGTQTAQGKI